MFLRPASFLLSILTLFLFSTNAHADSNGCIVIFKKEIRAKLKKDKRFKIASFSKQNRHKMSNKNAPEEIISFTDDMLNLGASQVKSIAKGINLVKGLECGDISNHPMVSSSENNKPLELMRTPNDLKYQSNTLNNAHQAIKSEQAWNIKTDSSNEVVIAIIDDGLYYSHDDLRSNVLINSAEIDNNGRLIFYQLKFFQTVTVAVI